jgi:hypothetical protein
MRTDLAKCTTEKERGGSSLPSKKYSGRVRVEETDSTYDKEFGGLISSARRRQYGRGWDCKEFSDVLNPLKGTLRKNVGRPWDDVYSEFCQVLDNRSNSGIHIIGHMRQYVAMNCFMSNGKVWEHSPYSGQVEVWGFYVHPITGILCHVGDGRWRHHYKARPKAIVSVPNGAVTYELKGGFTNKQKKPVPDKWFAGTWVDVPKREAIYKRDVLGRAIIDPKTREYVVVEYKTTYEKKFTQRKSCNKKDMEFIRKYFRDHGQALRPTTTIVDPFSLHDNLLRYRS